MTVTYDSRIAIYSPIFSSTGNTHGGITPVVKNLAEAFVRLGVQVDLLIRLPPGRMNPSLTSGIRVINIGRHSKLADFVSLYRYAKSCRPDAILSAGHRFNIVASWLKRLLPSQQVVLSVHNAVVASAGTGAKAKKRVRIMSRLYPAADGIVAVSQGIADELVALTKIDRSHTRVIYNPIITPELMAQADESLEHPWFGNDKFPVILGVGRLVEQKAFDVLIRAFARVRHHRECRLVILGEGEQRDELEHLVDEEGLGEHVSLPGFVPNVLPYMKQASLFVLSSEHEGFGNVIVEALAVNTPVVATDCHSGPAEILGDGKWGRLVPVGDVEALSEAMLKCLNGGKPEVQLEAVKPYIADEVAARYASYMGLPMPTMDLQAAGVGEHIKG